MIIVACLMQLDLYLRIRVFQRLTNLEAVNYFIFIFELECLFIGFILVVAQYILARPLEYPEVFLGRPPKDYARWIQQPDKWGGAIELAIFSDIYGVEIGSFDVKSGRMDLFGEGRNFHNRVYLQYTGIHYEAFYQKFNTEIITIFPVSDGQITEQIRELVMASRAAHKYIDTALFTLRCDECRIGLRGQGEAQKHARDTNHFGFIEYE